ncbi:MetQ/NlpA family ABC transporter substrate-binding protein [Clostridium magnum]|uniref:Lipoprotein n=1 Tax=Clostridium magnum DSM 2767 TaxID=1121326 RepID=A0A162S6R5_9CLOT|nr:MetQ/NlpA family ABC transporter substrate-binding protein [Clostridium magnum]KZL90850.1 membrane lipoprotein TpN32 precursor [Clostridium magnum DSM 2767]SHI12177.1 D-methionine transport system substrate-binding protein [Clostridium magnum DSM 2767]
MKKGRILSIAISALLVLGLAGCGQKQDTAKQNDASKETKKVIKIGASPVPHKEILEVVKPILQKEGYDLQIVEFTDYVTPNTALNDGELDANFFQHVPYLTTFNQEKHTDLSYTAKVHIEPMGVYSNKVKKIEEIKDGAEIAIPNDPTNGARALKVLQTAGLIKLKDGDLVSKLDITENKKNIKIKELEAPQLPRVLNDVDAAVINTNYAIEAKLNPTKDAIAIEAKDSPYANIIVVRTKDKDQAFVQALNKAVNSAEVKKFIEDKYQGSIIPAF